MVDDGYDAPEGSLTPVFDRLDADRPQQPVALEPIVTGLTEPTGLVWYDGKWVIIEKGGRVLTATADGVVSPVTSLDVVTVSEQGLLGIAPHPTKPLVFTHRTVARGGKDQSLIEAWNWPDFSPSHEVLAVDQPYQNHNAGDLAFGPDGMLYVGFGDGGYRDDPHGHGQNARSLLGSMVRLDVDSKRPYAVPADNPFADGVAADARIWATGLRNPWRFHIAGDGRLIIADVGQNTTEEVSVASAGDNLGWNVREGDHCFPPKAQCTTAPFVDPVVTYGRKDGVSITGGVVGGGGALAGRYVYGDFATGRLWSVKDPTQEGANRTVTSHGRFGIRPSSFALGPDGSVVVADYSGGAVYRMRAATQ